MNEKSFVCTGDCLTCGRCFSRETKDQKSPGKGMMTFPPDFMWDSGQEGLGLAFDLGTTTLAALLWNRATGTLIGTQTMLNPQRIYGADVISRITYAGETWNHMNELQQRLLQGVHQLKDALLNRFCYHEEKLTRAVFCGNTTMSHFLLREDPRGLALSPFQPAYEGEREMDGKELGFMDHVSLYVLPNIAGHVGGDITAGMVSSRVLKRKGCHLFMDLGTNGEIVLAEDGNGLACSTAAGPAFEGASLSCGCRAGEGAIDEIVIQEEMTFHTIGNGKPVGICGSGILSAVAEMRKAGLINRRGRLIGGEEWEEAHPYSPLGKRLVTRGKERLFLLWKEGDEEVAICQQDIREVQMAKSAIRTGVELLLKRWKRTPEDLTGIYMAGAFGNTLKIEDALYLGVLPPVAENRVQGLGNTAGAGASMVLLSEEEEDGCYLIPQKLEHVELALDEDFQENYLKYMDF